MSNRGRPRSKRHPDRQSITGREEEKKNLTTELDPQFPPRPSILQGKRSMEEGMDETNRWPESLCFEFQYRSNGGRPQAFFSPMGDLVEESIRRMWGVEYLSRYKDTKAAAPLPTPASTPKKKPKPWLKKKSVKRERRAYIEKGEVGVRESRIQGSIQSCFGFCGLSFSFRVLSFDYSEAFGGYRWRESHGGRGGRKKRVLKW